MKNQLFSLVIVELLFLFIRNSIHFYVCNLLAHFGPLINRFYLFYMVFFEDGISI